MIKDLEEEACLPGHAFFVPFPVFSGKIFVCEKTEKTIRRIFLIFIIIRSAD
jgi:hypothetical protein